jgi:putative pyruvate formate lyase activating enzyme
MGEEPPISGKNGSGVIFFSHCAMKCVYCQNFRFSQKGAGYDVTPDALSKIMLSLKDRGCHNVNLVTAAHYLPMILEALLLAREESFDLPVVYNTSGYESTGALEILDGVVDIYLANMRYSDNTLSLKYSNAADYADVNRKAVLAMYQQVGGLRSDGDGVGLSGMIIRHLVMPNLLKNTDETLRYISSHISKEAHVSLMSQYIPLYKAGDFPELSRKLTDAEYAAASNMLESYGLVNGWIQKY